MNALSLENLLTVSWYISRSRLSSFDSLSAEFVKSACCRRWESDAVARNFMKKMKMALISYRDVILLPCLNEPLANQDRR